MCIPHHCPRRDTDQEEMKAFRCGQCCRRKQSPTQRQIHETPIKVRRHSRHRVEKPSIS